MRRLASDRGCLICHTIEPARSEDPLPFGPAWREVAKRYKGQKGAVERLTRIVREGTEGGSSEGHWKGKAAGGAMLPNRVEISEAEAARLVRWILSLDH